MARMLYRPFLTSFALFASIATALLGQDVAIEQRFQDLRHIAQPPPLTELPDDRSQLPQGWLGVASWNIQVGGTSASPGANRPAMVRSALGTIFGGTFQILAAQEVSGRANSDVLTSLLPGGPEHWIALFRDTSDPQDNGIWFSDTVQPSAFSTLFLHTTTDSAGRPLVDDARTTHPPVVGSFRVGDFDFTLITVHLAFADGDTSESARELEHILDYLDSYFNTPGRDPDVIIAGDFNMPTRLSGQSGDGGMLLDTVFDSDPRFQLGDRRFVATVHEPTSRNGAAQGGLPRNSYDHFVFSVDALEELIQARRVDPDILTSHPEDPELRLTSDHFPIVALFRTTGEGISLDAGADQSAAITAVVNGASFREGISAGSWISVFGTALASTSRIWRTDEIIDGILPTALDGIGVLVNGKPASTYFVSPGQLNVQAPDDAALGPVTVEVQQNGTTVASAIADLRPAAPGLFAFDPQGRKYLAAVHPDGTLAGPEGLFGDAVTTRPVAPGDIVLLFGTGFGATDPAVPSGSVFSGASPLANHTRVLMGGIDAEVLFAGLSSAGLNQLNVRVPETVAAGDVEVIAETQGYTTQAGAFLYVDAQGSVPPPTVTLTASQSSIQQGESTTLQWTSSNAASIVIDQGIGAVAAQGSLVVTPAANTIYTLTATGPGGSATQSVTITVIPAAAPSVAVTASPPAIQSGQSSTLQWTTQNATTVSIDHGIGVVELNGSRTVSPTQTTTYTITAQGNGGTAQASVTLTVSAPKPAVTLTADPQSIQQGQPSTLQWTSSNATSVSIDQGIGSVSPNGSKTVSPNATTTYTITAEGPGGVSTASTTVSVTALPAPGVSLTASPQSIQSGQSAILQWTSNNAASVSIDHGIGAVSLNGSKTVSPSVTTTYTITAQGAGGVTSDSATVTVGPGDFGPCGTKTTCGQMNSCAEALHFLNVCKVQSLDRDKDGVPCESICPGG